MLAIASGDVTDTEILKLLELFYSILISYCIIYKRKEKRWGTKTNKETQRPPPTSFMVKEIV